MLHPGRKNDPDIFLLATEINNNGNHKGIRDI